MAAIAPQPESIQPTEADSLLLRLYPAPWRARYGAEFAELLAARPPSTRDRLDIVRGAVDARVRPQLADTRPPRVVGMGDRTLALAAAAVGMLFSTWAGIIVYASPRWGEAGSVGNDLLAASYGAGLLGALLAIAVLIGMAHRHVDDFGPIAAIGAIVTAAGFLAMSAGGVLSIMLVGVGTLAMSAGLARALGWLVAAAVVGATLFICAAMLGFASSGGQDLMWLWMLVGYGPSWMLLGFSLRRGARARPAQAVGA
jgi:hypothetical protein